MRAHRVASLACIGTLLTVAAACGSPEKRAAAPAPPPPAASAPPPVAPAAKRYDAVDRVTFNATAARLDLPLFWIADTNHDGAMQPAETAALLFYPSSPTAQWTTRGTDGERFTPAFEEAYARIVAATKDDGTERAPTPEERVRRKLVLEDLDQGRPTLVANDLSGLTEDEKAFVKHVLAASNLIDRLYAQQVGAAALADGVPEDDPGSQSLFRRDWGPKCLQPKTEKNPACSAIPGAPKPICDAYPAALQSDPAFCEKLEKLPNAKALLDPFVVVREAGAGAAKPEGAKAGDAEKREKPGARDAGDKTDKRDKQDRRDKPANAEKAEKADKGAKPAALEPVPFATAYKALMEPIAAELRAAADAVKDAKEGPLKAYLLAAAKSFLDNDWTPADEAWAKMNATNSAWFLRIAPDEVYWDPCNHKAGFHVTFARINKDSLAWQDKLVPVEQTMEQNLATLIGKPYAARKVTFHLPDFIDVVVNAGDDRKDTGATIGQSLPNWGPVANEGRGRTVAMSNLYTDPDSLAARRAGAESLLAKDVMGSYADSPNPGLLSTILHEATHNLGPAHEYKVRGKTDAQWFGGGLASMMEELKAQTGALYFVDFLRQRGIIDADMAKRTYVDSVVWSFGHVSRGMYTDTGGRKAYSQLSAIQLGFLLDEGALTWDEAVPAANGSDKGAFTFHFEKFPAAVEKLMKIVGGLKANGDKAGAEALAKKYVDGNIVPQKTITERWLRHPKQSFVYAVKL